MMDNEWCNHMSFATHGTKLETPSTNSGWKSLTSANDAQNSLLWSCLWRSECPWCCWWFKTAQCFWRVFHISADLWFFSVAPSKHLTLPLCSCVNGPPHPIVSLLYQYIYTPRKLTNQWLEDDISLLHCLFPVAMLALRSIYIYIFYIQYCRFSIHPTTSLQNLP